MLSRIKNDGFGRLKNVLLSAHSVLWVTYPCGSIEKPGFGMAKGLMRVLRAEQSERLLVSLALEENLKETQICSQMSELMKSISADLPLSECEREYVGADRVQIPRFEPYETLDRHIENHCKPVQLVGKPIGDAPPPRMDVKIPGLLDSIDFVEDVNSRDPLDKYDVEIEVKAIGVNFLDVLAALGRVQFPYMGVEAAGVVKNADQRSGFRQGHRVMGLFRGAYRTRARSSHQCVIAIPDSMSFAVAASIPCCFATAYYALNDVARLSHGDSVLIHAAAGGTGQAAVQVAQNLGAEVYATAGSEEKKSLLTRLYGVQADHIFHSRDVSFAHGIMRKTSNKGVDVILNSLSGPGLVASWECVAPFGRFVEIGKNDIMAREKLPMFPFKDNVSFAAFDLAHLFERRPSHVQRTLRGVLKMFAAGHLGVIQPLQTFSASGVEQAFRYMQSGRSMGKLVVELKSDDAVAVSDDMAWYLVNID